MAAGVVDPLSPTPGGHAESLEMQRSVSEHADGCLEMPDIGPTAGFTYPIVKNSGKSKGSGAGGNQRGQEIKGGNQRGQEPF